MGWACCRWYRGGCSSWTSSSTLLSSVDGTCNPSDYATHHCRCCFILLWGSYLPFGTFNPKPSFSTYCVEMWAPFLDLGALQVSQPACLLVNCRIRNLLRQCHQQGSQPAALLAGLATRFSCSNGRWCTTRPMTSGGSTPFPPAHAEERTM